MVLSYWMRNTLRSTTIAAMRDTITLGFQMNISTVGSQRVSTACIWGSVKRLDTIRENLNPVIPRRAVNTPHHSSPVLRSGFSVEMMLILVNMKSQKRFEVHLSIHSANAALYHLFKPPPLIDYTLHPTSIHDPALPESQLPL